MGVKMVDRRTDGTQRRPLGALTFPGVPVSFLPRSPMAAMTAKYWMTLLVLTVFPAPDSPLGVGGGGGSEFWRWSWGAEGWGGDQPLHVGWNSRDEDRLVLPIWWDEKGDIRPRSCTSHPTDPPKKGDGGEVMGPRMSPGEVRTCQHVLVGVI